MILSNFYSKLRRTDRLYLKLGIIYKTQFILGTSIPTPFHIHENSETIMQEMQQVF